MYLYQSNKKHTCTCNHLIATLVERVFVNGDTFIEKSILLCERNLMLKLMP